MLSLWLRSLFVEANVVIVGLSRRAVPLFVVSLLGLATLIPARAETTRAPGPTERASADLPNVISCLLPPAKLANAVVEVFLADPKTLLSAHPDAGPALIKLVRGLAASDTRAIDPLIALNGAATVQQRIALGIGLNEAATACVDQHPDIAALIQTKVAGLGPGELLTAFEDASNDLATADLGSVQGASPIGAGGAGGPGSGGLHGDALFPVSTGSFPIGGGGGGGSSTIVDVSPTKF